MGKMVRHMKGSIPSHGYMMIEESSLPLRDCSCNVCLRVGRNKSRSSSSRRFPASNGTVDGNPGYVQKSGDRTVGYSGPGNVGKIVSNDGVNASYLRNDDGEVVLDDNSPDPYNPNPWASH